MYSVYENGGNINVFIQEAGLVEKGWQLGPYRTKRQAEIMAFLWVYPVTKEDAFDLAPTMTPGKVYDFSICEIPVQMMIKEEFDK